ncbi:MAG: DUF3016 domain-containing protein [Acidobacteriota bacterium]
MRVNLYCLLLLLSVCVGTVSAGTAVTVSFTKPESYTDMGRYRDEPNAEMKEIEAHLKQLGERYLPPSQLLKIEVLDIDLAGRVNFSNRSGREVRILRGNADWPSIKLHYLLEADGRVLLERQENVADMGYLQRPNTHYSGRFLQYEKRMLDDWFRQRFATHKR